MKVSTVLSDSIDAIAGAGGKVTSAAFDPDASRMSVEVPQSTDVRSLVEKLEAVAPGIELVALNDLDRPVTKDTEPPDEAPGPALTDRQRQALEAAYRAEDFERPRGSTAEEVAGLLDIASPTFHAHPRKAEQAVLSVLFDVEGPFRDAASDHAVGP